jgi:hypothetical protein
MCAAVISYSIGSIWERSGYSVSTGYLQGLDTVPVGMASRVR